MQTIKRKTTLMAVILMLVIALFGTSNVFAASLPASACTGAGTGTVTCDLYAMTGTATLFGSTTVNIWGYSASSTLGTAGLPGPALIVNQGDVVTVNLHNVNLPEATSLDFQGQNLIPDATGVTAGNSTTYTFTASKPGTFLYQAGLNAGGGVYGQHQVGLGMYGALVVESSISGTAYGTSATTYNEETIVVLSEVDPALNSSATPASFDMRKFAPKYFLINGQAYASGFNGDIPVTAGDAVLLRYVNAGLQGHAMATLGVSQKVIATDGFAYNHPYSMVAETIATGETLDALVTIPAAAANGTKYPLYDANHLLRNANASAMGGMLTFLTVGTGAAPVDTGPFATSPNLTPNPTNGTATVTVSATITDAGTLTVNNIAAAEFYIDSTSGTAYPMSATDGAFDSSTESVTSTAPISTLILQALASGNHTIYVRGQDSNGTWSSFVSVTLNLDKTGPASTGLALSPNPSSGAVTVTLSAAGNDTATGNSNVTAAEYWVDAGTHTAMTIVAGSASSIRNFTATIPSGLAQGTHVVSVRSQDAFGNWGAVSTINLIVSDTQAPTTSGVTASPNPNNGSTPYNTSTPAVRVFASFSDVSSGNSNIAAAEGFIDTIGTTGTGFAFLANDGLFNSPAESGYADIPLAVVGSLSQGNHTIYVHAKDAAGNWGAMVTVTLVIDKLPPAVSAVILTPTASNNTAVVVSATANDTATGNSNIGGGEYFIDTVGTAGTGAAMTPAAAAPNTTISATIPAATIGALSTGNHTVYVRAKDSAGNWSTTASATLLIDRTAPTFSSITLTPNSIPTGTASINLTVNGASDGNGGSGVIGGEWWIGTTNITAGTGTAFTGLTTSIPTASLVAGSYTVRVRIRDAAGNWSTGNNGVRTTTLTVTAPIADAIFSDGFESGNTSAWSSTSGTTSVTAGAALVGTRGLQVAGNGTNRVQYNFGTASNPVTANFDARFYFNPNGNASTGQDIFQTSTGTSNSSYNNPLFHVRYRRTGTNPNFQYQVQIQVGNTTNAAWINITNAAHYIEIVWQSGTSLQLYVDGSAVQSISTLTTGSVSSFRLGSVTSGGSSTLEYFDAFSAKRSVSPLIGP